MAQRLEPRTGATHTHVDRTHSLTHLTCSYNHVVRNVSAAITIWNQNFIFEGRPTFFELLTQ